MANESTTAEYYRRLAAEEFAVAENAAEGRDRDLHAELGNYYAERARAPACAGVLD